MCIYLYINIYGCGFLLNLAAIIYLQCCLIRADELQELARPPSCKRKSAVQLQQAWHNNNFMFHHKTFLGHRTTLSIVRVVFWTQKWLVSSQRTVANDTRIWTVVYNYNWVPLIYFMCPPRDCGLATNLDRHVEYLIKTNDSTSNCTIAAIVVGSAFRQTPRCQHESAAALSCGCDQQSTEAVNWIKTRNVMFHLREALESSLQTTPEKKMLKCLREICTPSDLSGRALISRSLHPDCAHFMSVCNWHTQADVHSPKKVRSGVAFLTWVHGRWCS